jgi:hypothetical protein
MYKLPTYLVVPIFFLPTYLYVRPTSIEWVTRMKLGSNSDEDHPQLSHHGHPVDGALVGAGSLWPELSTSAFGAFLLRPLSVGR